MLSPYRQVLRNLQKNFDDLSVHKPTFILSSDTFPI
jgi:hypothetical protein